tara:strand:- start:1243 stop:2103 length:861 start_codon:yes stop_codon:yes gene_type:complete
MSEELKQKILEYIQEYQAIRIDLAPRVSFLRFKVDLSEFIVELFKKEKLMRGKVLFSREKSFRVFDNEFDNYPNALLIVGRIQNRSGAFTGYVAFQENEARVERLRFPDSFSTEKYISKVRENVVDEFIEITGEAGVSANDRELIASQLLQEQQDKMVEFRDENRERALDRSREKGGEQQIATKNKEFISYREDEYVDFDKAFIIKGEVDNDRESNEDLMIILEDAITDRNKNFEKFDINPYVEEAYVVVENYLKRIYDDPAYIDTNDIDLIAMELLYEMEKERNM